MNRFLSPQKGTVKFLFIVLAKGKRPLFLFRFFRKPPFSSQRVILKWIINRFLMAEF